MVSEAVCNAMEAESRATETKKLTGMVGIEKRFAIVCALA